MSDRKERKRVTVTLENPIQRGETLIEQVTLRKPGAGELRGLSLQLLGQSDVNSLITLIPRISDPALAEHEVASLEIEDLSAIGNEVFDFFLTSTQRAKIKELLGT